jgi:hypothetical protein
MSLSLAACKTAGPNDQTATGDSAIEQSLDAQTAYELWEAANESRKASDSLSFELDSQMTLKNESSAEEFGMSMSGPIKVVSQSNSDAQMALDLRITALGQDLSMRAWYKDGYYYYSLLGAKLKQAMSVQDALAQNNMEFLSFSESAIRDQTLTITPDGSKKLSFVLDGTQMNKLIERALSSGSALSSVLGLGSLDVKMSDITVSAVIEPTGDLTECTYGFDAEFPADTAWTAAQCRVAMTHIRYDDVTIIFPDDLDSYRETSF